MKLKRKKNKASSLSLQGPEASVRIKEILEELPIGGFSVDFPEVRQSLMNQGADWIIKFAEVGVDRESLNVRAPG